MNNPRTSAPVINCCILPDSSTSVIDLRPSAYPLCHNVYPITIVTAVIITIGARAAGTLPFKAKGIKSPNIIGFSVPQSSVSPIPAKGPISPVLIPVIASSVTSA